MGYASRARQKRWAMIRVVQLQPISQHMAFFQLIFEAFYSRGSAPTEQRVSKEDRRSESRILRALKEISDPVGEEPKEGEIDRRLRTLKKEGGSLRLDQPDFSRLQRFVEQTQWQSGITDVVADLEDALETAEKSEP